MNNKQLRAWSTTPLVDPTQAIIEVGGEVAHVEDVPVGTEATVRFARIDTDPYLRFAPDYVDPIRAGDKTTTARYDFDRHLTVGDTVGLETPNGDPFATATVDVVAEMPLRVYANANLDAYHDYDDTADCIDALTDHYPDATIEPDTVLTVIRWRDVEPV
jgi:hypothetical protein